MILFQWTGAAPREARIDHRFQVSCVAAFPTIKAFREATGLKPGYIGDYVTVGRNAPSNVGNEGARLALANPGTVYWHDTLRHIPRDAPWFEHPNPSHS